MRACAHVRNCTRTRTIIVYMDRIIDRGRHIRIVVVIILACAIVFVCAPHIHNNINRHTRSRIHIRSDTYVVITRFRIPSRVLIRTRSRGRNVVLMRIVNIIAFPVRQRNRSRGSTSRARTRIRTHRGIPKCLRSRLCIMTSLRIGLVWRIVCVR